MDVLHYELSVFRNIRGISAFDKNCLKIFLVCLDTISTLSFHFDLIAMQIFRLLGDIPFM